MPRLVIILALLHLYRAALAQDDPNQNAAVWYQRAIDQYQHLPQATRDLLANYEPGQRPSAEIRAALISVQDILANMERGAAIERCDYNLDRSEGIDLMLPHLSSMRSIARVAKADALVRLNDGDTSGAAARLASLYRMSAHGGDDRIIISSLVGQAIYQLSDSVVQTALDQAAFSAADAATLLQSAQSMTLEDPFAYVEAIAGEQEIFVSDMKERLSDPANLTELFGQQAGLLAGLTEEETDTAIGQYDAAMTRVVEVFSMEDRAAAKTELDALTAEIELHQHGFLVSMLMPAYTRIFEQRNKAEESLAQRIEVLEKLAAGHAPPEAFANAATWYLRGIQLIEAIDSPKLKTIREWSAQPLKRPIDASLAQVLSKAQPTIDVFRDGSRIKRCDFKVVRSEHPLALAPGYVCGMHDALRLIELDARRLLQSGDHAAAADRLCTGIRIIGHVGADPHLASALVAHHDASMFLAAIETGLTAGALGDDQKVMLRDALELVPRKDPFGYLGAIVETRAVLAQWLNRQYTADQDQHDARTSSVEAIKTFNGDQLLYVLSMLDTMHRAAIRAQQPQADQLDASADGRARLADVLSIEAIDAASAAFHRVAPLVASDGWAVIAEHEIPALIPSSTIGHNLRKARGDLREAFMLLKASGAAPTE